MYVNIDKGRVEIIYVTRNDGIITISPDYVLRLHDYCQHGINTKSVNITSSYCLYRICRARTFCVNFSLQTIWFDSLDCKSKTEVPRDVRNSKVRTQDKFRRNWSRHYNTCKSQIGTGPGVRRSKRPLLACRTRCKCSMETSHN